MMKKVSKILVVDDDALHRKLLTYQLTKNGYQVLIASDGLEALDWLRVPGQQPDLILLDLLMPRFSGLDVLRKLKASASKLPVILMSAAEWPIANEGVTLSKPDAFLSKPFNVEKLVAKIEALLLPVAVV
ncbi:two-component system response regulator VicR/two-component system response regulator MprA/two-component system response regulator RegX3 [Larkinella arboricola]|uniref:Two-component system response regulator VicR/two-component system response regulator MprA/two-component system response regulator RegX3 n=1 Tax=Larkinella arboricola TaxID=643671 RepID=A0A327X347_LARAB|nr:response regulator transcription factor [Larkinella arboricola]RAJ99994.1 two-component system response regulator VicR/two-component system response regulator MprA/two-component system response regulator RegX3 [Larkinella arboricola]